MKLNSRTICPEFQLFAKNCKMKFTIHGSSTFFVSRQNKAVFPMFNIASGHNLRSPLGPDWNISSVGGTASKCCTDIYATKRVNPTDIGESPGSGCGTPLDVFSFHLVQTCLSSRGTIVTILSLHYHHYHPILDIWTFRWKGIQEAPLTVFYRVPVSWLPCAQMLLVWR